METTETLTERNLSKRVERVLVKDGLEIDNVAVWTWTVRDRAEVIEDELTLLTKDIAGVVSERRDVKDIGGQTSLPLPMLS